MTLGEERNHLFKSRGSGQPRGWDQKGAGGNTGNTLAASMVSINGTQGQRKHKYIGDSEFLSSWNRWAGMVAGSCLQDSVFSCQLVYQGGGGDREQLAHQAGPHSPATPSELGTTSHSPRGGPSQTEGWAEGWFSSLRAPCLGRGSPPPLSGIPCADFLL